MAEGDLSIIQLCSIINLYYYTVAGKSWLSNLIYFFFYLQQVAYEEVESSECQEQQVVVHVSDVIQLQRIVKKGIGDQNQPNHYCKQDQQHEQKNDCWERQRILRKVKME